MNTQSVGYKAKAFEPKCLGTLFLFISVLPMLLFTPLILGLLPWPGKDGKSLGSLLFLILMALLYTLPVILPIALTAITEGKPGVKALVGRLWRGKLSIRWFLVAALLWPVIFLVINVVAQTLEGDLSYQIFRPIEIARKYFFPGFLAVLPIVVLEEFCWRGYALPHLQVRWNALASSLILGVVWAMMHFPNWFMPPGSPTRTDSFWLFAGQIILTSILYTWIFNNMNGNLLGVILAHNMSNVVGTFMQVPNAYQIYQLWVLLAMVSLVVIFFGPKNLMREKPEPHPGRSLRNVFTTRWNSSG